MVAHCQLVQYDDVRFWKYHIRGASLSHSPIIFLRSFVNTWGAVSSGIAPGRGGSPGCKSSYCYL